MLYPKRIGWNPPSYGPQGDQIFINIGENSTSHEGNFLEAVNLGLNEFDRVCYLIFIYLFIYFYYF